MHYSPLDPVTLPTINTQDIIKADSGSSKIYLQGKHAKYLQDLHNLSNGPSAIIPDGSTIQATAQGNLPLHKSINTNTLVYLNLNNESLLSIGKLYDQGCIAIFDKNICPLFKMVKLLLKGFGIWEMAEAFINSTLKEK